MDQMTAEIERTEIPSALIHPPTYTKTLEKVAKEIPSSLEPIKRVLDSIDRQAFPPRAFEVPEFPGTTIPYCTISVNKVAEEAFGLNSKTLPTIPSVKEANGSEVICILPAWNAPTDSSLYLGWNVIYERTIQALPRIARAIKNGEPVPKIDVVIAGGPANTLGTVSPEWLSGVRKRGFEQHGRAYAALFKNAMPQAEDPEQKPNIFLWAASEGGPIATYVRRNLPDFQIKTLIENPVGMNNVLKRIQGIIGFMAEGAYHGLTSAATRADFKALGQYARSVDKELRQNGLLPASTENQASLKLKASLLDVWGMLKGIPMDKELRTYIYEGIYDPTRTGLINLARNLNMVIGRKTTNISQNGRNLKFAIHSSHAMERLRLNKWKNVTAYCARSAKVAEQNANWLLKL